MSAEFDGENSMNFSEEDEQLWSLLSAYVDGETTPAESAIVEAHLRSDAAYAQDFAFLKAASRQVIQIGEVEPPTQLREAIFAATINKPTFSRRLAQAMAQFQAAFLPRYALPAGALAAGMLAAFLLIPKTAVTPPDNTPSESPAVTSAPSNSAVSNDSVAMPPVEIVPPKRHSEPQKMAAEITPRIAVPKQPTAIDWNRMLNVSVREGSSEKKVANVKTQTPKTQLAVTSQPDSKKTAISPKTNTTIVKSNAPLPKTNDMYNDFSPVPNMDRGNQRVIVSNPPVEPLPNEEVTPTTSDAATASNPNTTDTAHAVVVQAGAKTVQLRSGRTLPDTRRVATAAQFRQEESAFQHGMNRNTMLAMQREELSGSTMTRF